MMGKIDDAKIGNSAFKKFMLNVSRCTNWVLLFYYSIIFCSVNLWISLHQVQWLLFNHFFLPFFLSFYSSQLRRLYSRSWALSGNNRSVREMMNFTQSMEEPWIWRFDHASYLVKHHNTSYSLYLGFTCKTMFVHKFFISSSSP